MRILVLSDIHANLAALQVVREPFDVALCLGDTVEYGPNPVECLSWVRENCRYLVRGNHDHGCAQNVAVPGQVGFRYLTKVTREATQPLLNPCDRRLLATLPLSRMVSLGGLRFLLVHASPRDPLEEYVPCDAEMWAARLQGIKADFVCVGHTHQQFYLPVNGMGVLNPGSVGLPRDGDPRARYAIIDNGKVTLHQAEYDLHATIAAVNAFAIPEDAKGQLADIYCTGRFVHINGKS